MLRPYLARRAPAKRPRVWIGDLAPQLELHPIAAIRPERSPVFTVKLVAHEQTPHLNEATAARLLQLNKTKRGVIIYSSHLFMVITVSMTCMASFLRFNLRPGKRGLIYELTAQHDGFEEQPHGSDINERS